MWKILGQHKKENNEHDKVIAIAPQLSICPEFIPSMTTEERMWERNKRLLGQLEK